MNNRQIYRRSIAPHNSRVMADGGIPTDNVNAAIELLRHFEADKDNIKHFTFPALTGIKTRNSGINRFITKLYSINNPQQESLANDAVQTTSTNQPHLGGNIAPNEIACIKNPNGGSNFMTHPTISFAANEAWSVTTVLNWNGLQSAESYLWGTNNIQSRFGIKRNGNNVFCVRGQTATGTVTGGNTTNLLGKNSIITSVFRVGGGILDIYVNGVLNCTITTTTNFDISTLFANGGDSVSANGKVYAHIIRSGLLTDSQVLSEYNLIRNFIPEVESVQIGTQTWATSNCEMAATPQGTIIPEMQLATNTERVVNGNFESGLIGTLTSADEVSSWTLNSTNPISGTKDGLLQVTTIGTNSSRPRLTLDITALSSLAKYIKVTFNYKVNSGTVSFVGVYSGSGQYVGNTSLSGSGTYVVYIPYVSTAGQYLSFDGTKLFSIQIDNISVQEIGWSGSQELYDGIYAQTTGTVEQKTYTALKAAAFWRHYNNDVAKGALYGKQYNGYAKKLLILDLASSNFGWHIPSDTELTTLSTQNTIGSLKKEGNIYWTNPNGTNTTGLSLIGAPGVNNIGNDGHDKSNTQIWSSTNENRLTINDDNTFDISNRTDVYGYYIRLVKD